MDNALILTLVKTRLNRLNVPNSQIDEYLITRIEAAIDTLKNTNGIKLTNVVADNMLVCDYVVWEYGNRDKSEAMPQWLRVKLRERWISSRGDSVDS